MNISRETKLLFFKGIAVGVIGLCVTVYRLWLMPVPQGFEKVDIKSTMHSSENITPSTPLSKVNLQKNNPPKSSKIWVHIAGQVVYPGLYQVTENIRVKDIITLAGGIGPNGNLDNINLAKPVTDGQKINIPAKSSKKERPTSSKTESINLNLSTASELEAIPGVGPSTAQKIVDYRHSHGSFKTLEELTQVNGIGEKSLQKIYPYITL